LQLKSAKPPRILRCSFCRPREDTELTVFDQQRDRARLAVGEELKSLLYHPSPKSSMPCSIIPRSMIRTSACCFPEKTCQPRSSKNIAGRKTFLKSYAVKRALVFHPSAPRLAAFAFCATFTSWTSSSFPCRPTLLLNSSATRGVHHRPPPATASGQRITLARRGPARVAGALIATGHAQVLEIALDNPRLTEAQVLKVLWHDKLPQVVVLTVANHRKWSQHYNVRLALVRNSSTRLRLCSVICRS